LKSWLITKTDLGGHEVSLVSEASDMLEAQQKQKWILTTPVIGRHYNQMSGANQQMQGAHFHANQILDFSR